MNRWKKWESDNGVKFPTQRMTSIEYMDWAKENLPRGIEMTDEEWNKMVYESETGVNFMKGFVEFEERIKELKKG